MSQSIEDFLAQLNGTVEALCLAYAGLVATHPDPAGQMKLLHSMLEALKTPEGGAELSSQQKAYEAGTKAAVERLAVAVKLAIDTRAMGERGPVQ